jgi:superfamily II DNA or RNA helicase
MYIECFNALAGAGKTYALVRRADRLARRKHKVLFVQPTKHLIDKTIADELEPLGPSYPVRRIHGDANPSGSVVGDIVAHFQTTPRHQGEVLFITHAALFRLSYIHRQCDWVLIMDEVPQVDVFEELNLPDTHHLITPYLTLKPCGAAYGHLLMRDAQ